MFRTFLLFFCHFEISQNRQRLTWEKVEDLKMEHCYITQDYASEVRLFQALPLSTL